MSCCGNPDPKVLEKNGRLFCKNCRRYLDVKTEPPELDPDALPPLAFDPVKAAAALSGSVSARRGETETGRGARRDD